MRRDSLHDIPDLFGALIAEIRALLSAEARLAKAELARKARKVKLALVLLAIAAVLAFIGLQALVAAAVILLAEAGLSWGASALLVGVAWPGILGA